ncbi:MAG: cell division FtsA domain-containing protein [Patescibacteria group bacterium]
MKFLDRILGYNELNFYAIALDVGTEYVKALIFKVEEGVAHIVGAGRTHQALKDMQGGAITDISGVIANCSTALDSASKMAGVMPDRVIMGIAGELVKGATTTITYTRKNADKKIDQKELKEIMGRVQEKAYGQIRSQIAWETGKAEIDVRLVNAAIVDVRIDRHQVSNPIGFTGKHVKVDVYNAFAPMIYLGALESTAENLGLDLLGIAAEPYAVAKCVGMEQGKDFSAIFIDIGGGTTDIAVVRAGGLEGTRIFSIGGRAFTKRIARELDLVFGEAEELKLSYSRGTLEAHQKEQVQKVISDDIAIWLKGVTMILREFGDSELLPRRMLLCGGGSLLPEVRHSLASEQWHKDLPFAGRPIVEFIEPGDVNNVMDDTGTLRDTSDVTSMALANLAVELIEGVNPMADVLRKTAENIVQ